MRHRLAVRLLVPPLTVLCACSGGHGSTATVATGPLVVTTSHPPNDVRARLNDEVRVTFSAPLDPGSLTPDAMQLRELDAAFAPTARVVPGTFELVDGGRTLQFVPALARDASLATGGFQPDRVYELRLTGRAEGAATVRDGAGNALAYPFALVFRTVGGLPTDVLYRDPVPGPPRIVAVELDPPAGGDVPLGLFGARPLEVRVQFDQPLDPAADNVPTQVVTDPARRDPAQRGRVHLEYADPEDEPGTFRWIPADVEIARNANDGATVVLRPIGVLPNHATVRVVVEPALHDLVGESNEQTPGYARLARTFRTAAAWQPQWSAVVARFDAEALDAEAGFAEAAAVATGDELEPAAFPGGSDLDFAPVVQEVVLHTSVGTLVPVEGAPVQVTGGVYHLRNLTIPQGVTVRGAGPNPLVLVCRGKVVIAGTLTVRGGNGERARGIGGQYRGPGDFAGPAPVLPAGAWFETVGAAGIGTCGGGSGGARRYSVTERNFDGTSGRDGRASGGGAGGRLACTAGCYTGSGYNSSGGGSGGGGGSCATQGDPHYRGVQPASIVPNTPPTANTAFQQVLGFGGSGCSGGSGTRTGPTGFVLPGGEPGTTLFPDARADNDFWGTAYDARRRLRIRGELALPTGGGGGGAGGDTSWLSDCSPSASPAFDFPGGNGGGGGGVVVVQALDEIWVTSTGRVIADGGHGGGGAQSGASGEAGGGGGGAGGMVVLMSAKAIRIEAHGNPTTNRFVYGDTSNGPFLGNDYAFAISADGGVCTTGGFGAVNVTSKYPASGQPPMPGSVYDQDPLGGFGGMGIVQLMVPSGTNADGTNTALDDNVHFHLPGELALTPLPAPLGAAAKRQLLAWRGFPDESGTPVDDFGTPTDIGVHEGDIRPSPVLMPAPFGTRSRARSKWIDTGATVRRVLAAPDDGARGVVASSAPGPAYEFAGTRPDGFASWGPSWSNGATLVAPVAAGPVAIAAAPATVVHQHAPAYRVDLAAPLAATAGRYRGYAADLLDAGGGVLVRLDVLDHDGTDLTLAAAAALPDGATHVRIVAAFFGVVTPGRGALPAAPLGPLQSPVPTANVRLGFAFHVDPTRADPLDGRYPPTGTGDFVYDLAAPELRAWLAANRPRFVQWDATFDLAYDAGFGPPPAPLPDTARPRLTSLRLPFGF
jgi:hypothetical protein